MGNLIEIQSQIEKLQKQADAMRAKEFDHTVRDILDKMQAFGITVKDLRAVRDANLKAKVKVSQNGSGGKAKRGAVASQTVAAKYRGPNGEAWSGRGLTPRWLTALLAQGKKKEDFVAMNR